MLSPEEVRRVAAAQLPATPPVLGPGSAPPPAPGRPPAGSEAPVRSPQAELAQKALEALKGISEVRPDVVARARARLASGSWPSGREVARQMLSRSLADRWAGRP